MLQSSWASEGWIQSNDGHWLFGLEEARVEPETPTAVPNDIGTQVNISTNPKAQKPLQETKNHRFPLVPPVKGVEPPISPSQLTFEDFLRCGAENPAAPSGWGVFKKHEASRSL